MYTAEIFPAAYRSAGIGFSISAVQLWSAILNGSASIAFARISWKFYLVFVCSTFVIMIIMFLYFPEVSLTPVFWTNLPLTTFRPKVTPWSKWRKPSVIPSWKSSTVIQISRKMVHLKRVWVTPSTKSRMSEARMLLQSNECCMPTSYYHGLVYKKNGRYGV